MVRKLMAVAAVSGLMLSTALAETQSNAVTTPSGAQTHVITQQSSNQWLGSTLIGMSVVDPDNNTVGDVNDILIEKDGRVQALVVGVGGFLGIGEKSIALPMTAFRIVPANTESNKSSTDQLRLSMTKDELQKHAEFKTKSDRDAATTGSGASSGSRASGANPESPAAVNRNRPAETEPMSPNDAPKSNPAR